MKTHSIHRILTSLLIAAAVTAIPLVAQATGTAVGTAITNKAAVNYQIGGVSQTLIESSPAGNSTPGAGNGANTSFVVDDKVIITVADNSGGAVTTTPGSTGQQAMKFTITNGGNGPHDVVVSTANIADTMTGGPSTAALYEDTNANGTYDAGVDLAAGAGGAVYLKLSGGTAYIDEMPAAPAAGSSRDIFVVITTPITALNGETANYSLTATAYNDLNQVRAGGTGGSLGNITVANSGSADTASLIDIVLAEAAGDGGDAANNGTYTKNGTNGFTVASITLSVQKTSAVISDPVNAGVNPKAIPLAIMEYTIRVTYTGGSGSATSVELRDNVPTNTVAQTNVYGGTGEVELTTFISGVTTTTTPDSGALPAWGTAAGSLIRVPCGSSLATVNDYCQIKYQIQIQ